MAEVPPALLAQLKVGGRLAAIVGDEPMMRATFVTRTGEQNYETLQPWDTVAPRLLNFPEPFALPLLKRSAGRLHGPFPASTALPAG